MYDIVVSTENNHYMAWQAMLFHASCVRHQKQAPIVMVHMAEGDRLLPGFERIRATGGRIQTAPDYRSVGGVNYPPRNTAASLKHVQTDADTVIVCDPDMVFLQPIPPAAFEFAEHQVTFDAVGYLNPDLDVYQPAVDESSVRAGVDPRGLRNPQFNGGVPHVIARRHQPELSRNWLEIMELFPDVPPAPPEDPGARPRGCHVGPQKDWLCTMWALAMSCLRMGLEPVQTRYCITTQNGGRPLPPLTPSGPFLLHYCYQDHGFGKHSYDTEEAAMRTVWHLPDDDGTVCGNIRGQLHEACQFFGI